MCNKYNLFYVSKNHLSIILLENLKNIDNKNIVTFFEDSIETEFNSVKSLSNYNLDNLQNVDFSSCSNINKNISDNSVFIIEGSIDFIEQVNDYILSNNLDNVEIVNCLKYDYLNDFNAFDKYNDLLCLNENTLQTFC